MMSFLVQSLTLTRTGDNQLEATPVSCQWFGVTVSHHFRDYHLAVYRIYTVVLMAIFLQLNGYLAGSVTLVNVTSQRQVGYTYLSASTF